MQKNSNDLKLPGSCQFPSLPAMIIDGGNKPHFWQYLAVCTVTKIKYVLKHKPNNCTTYKEDYSEERLHQ